MQHTSILVKLLHKYRYVFLDKINLLKKKINQDH